MELKAIAQLCAVQGNQWYPRTDVEKSTYWQWQHYLLRQLVMYSGTLPWSNVAKFTKVLHFANANRKHMKWVQGKNGHKVAHFLTKDMTQTFRQRCLTQRNGWQHTQNVQVTFPQRNIVLKETKSIPLQPQLFLLLASHDAFLSPSSLRWFLPGVNLVSSWTPAFLLWLRLVCPALFPQLPLANREGGSKQAKHTVESPFH